MQLKTVHMVFSGKNEFSPVTFLKLPLGKAKFYSWEIATSSEVTTLKIWKNLPSLSMIRVLTIVLNVKS